MLLRTIIDVIIRHPKLIKRCAIVNCIKFIKKKKLHNYIKKYCWYLSQKKYCEEKLKYVAELRQLRGKKI